MPKFVQVTKDICIVQQEVKAKKRVNKRELVNHIWVYDRSGSMSGVLSELTRQLISLSKDLPKGDTLTLGWFSGEGDFNFVFKGFKISDNSDYRSLEKAIEANSTARNTTCFSEILGNMDTVISDLSVFSNVFSFHFFTDGYPVVSNHKKEVENVFAAIKKIKGKLHTAMMVGYGAYYNKEFMSQMAEKMGALLIHSSMIPEYANTITKLIKLTDSSEPKEEIEPLISEPIAVYTVTDQGVTVYSVDEDGKLYVSPQKDVSTKVFYISREKPNTKSWDRINTEDVNFADKDDVMAKGLYAAALVLTQQVKTDIALEVVGKIGDKRIVDAITNAFTVEEYGKVEESLNSSIQQIQDRFLNGRDSNYLPPVDAFCVFDLLKLLIDDENSAFYPNYEKFSYEKIGVASKSSDEYSKFIPNKDNKCPFEDLTWNSKRLNLSVLTRIDGTVKLSPPVGKNLSDFGFSETYPVHRFRNYTFIVDGKVNFEVFYVSSSESVYNIVKNKGQVVDDEFMSNGVYGINISSIPSINRKMVTGKTSATELCKMAYEEHKLKAQIKALKWLKEKDFDGKDISKVTHFNEAQKELLELNGINIEKGGLYNPPSTKAESTDKYMAKYFEIKMKGLATLPTVAHVVEKITAKKARTPVESLVENGIVMFNNSKPALDNDKVKLAWFESTILDSQKKMKELRNKIQETKFAVILGKSWFDEFTDRNNTQLTVDGVTFNFELGEMEVEF